MEPLKKLDFSFEVINKSNNELYSDGCSNAPRSACCTRVCTRDARPADVKQWEKYLNDNKGMLMY